MRTKSQTKPAAAKSSASPLLHSSCAALEQRLGPIEERAVDTLRAYEGHARKHPEKQIVQLMASIGHFGFTMPVLIDEGGVLIAGHARLEAARRLGMVRVPTMIARSWSKAQIKAYRLADNQLSRHATWDEDLLRIEIASIIDLDQTPIEILGWETGEIDLLLDGAGLDDEHADEDLPELPAQPVSRRATCGCSASTACSALHRWSRVAGSG